MNIRKVIQRRIRHRSQGVDFVGDVNAVISANVGPSNEPRSRSEDAGETGSREEHRKEGGSEWPKSSTSS